MGMYDTYVPCQKLMDVLSKETFIKTFDWQTKSLKCELLDLNINENLQITQDGCHYQFDSDHFIDDPYVSKGTLLLEFVNDELTSILHINNSIDEYGSVKVPDVLIEFINIDSYEVSKIYDFDHKCKALIKRNYLYNLHLYG